MTELYPEELTLLCWGTHQWLFGLANVQIYTFLTALDSTSHTDQSGGPVSV